MRTFYREAGPRRGPVVLLPHGYPCSSYQFRKLLPVLDERWRLAIAEPARVAGTARSTGR